MFGLIAALTPVLYKHVADRRQDIDNINEANVMLVLKNRAAEYIEANKDTLSVGTTVLTPTDIGVEIGGYTIGIRKRSDGSVSAMIASTSGGNDMKAAKVASLLGVSAGIYSAQDTARAWGINGVWAENISNYGFTSLPAGVPVVTTDYEKENTAVLDMEEIFAAIEEHEFAVLKAKELCLNGDCITNWDRENPVETIQKCNMGIAASCKRGYENTYNRTCKNIYDTYQENHDTFTSGFYTLTQSETSFTPQQYCMCDGDTCYSAKEIIEKCNTAKDIANKFCQAGYTSNINTTCANILSYMPDRKAEINTLTSETETIEACCAGNDELRQNVPFTLSNAIVSSGQIDTIRTMDNLCKAKYALELKGEGGYWDGGYFSTLYTGAGGLANLQGKFEKNDFLVLKAIGTYRVVDSQHSGAGVVVYLNGNAAGNIILAAGGGAQTDSGSGGGYYTGCSYNLPKNTYTYYIGWSAVTESRSTTNCNTKYSSASTNTCVQSGNFGACGGRIYIGSGDSYAYGGIGFCASGYECLLTPGGGGTFHQSGGGEGGNRGQGSASITFLGAE
ncbi:MAG: hypothetical protein IKD08_06390 [Alphaproteobacteria bacterium]|nr:hypothetical protein [Alphaproteobacteria bacterium]